MQQYIYILRPARTAMLEEGPTPEEAETITRHAAYVKGLVDRGTGLLAGRTLQADQTTFGIFIIRAKTDRDAAAIMNADPAVAEGVMTAEIFPYRVAFLAEETGSWRPE